MSYSTEKASQLISYWLRHNPQDALLTMDNAGWTSTASLLHALQQRGILSDLEQLIALNHSTDKVRWEISPDGARIRATHGHSISMLPDYGAAAPPAALYHGTSTKSVAAIASNGLLPMGRQAVHLSEDEATAVSVGARHGRPVIIEIDAEELAKDDHRFYRTAEGIWLTAAVPPAYLSFQPWYRLAQPNENFIHELRREIGNRPLHTLHSRLPHLKAVWKSHVADDVLFEDEITGKCYKAHLTYRMAQEADGWPAFYEFASVNEWIELGLRRDQQDFYGLS